MNRLLATLMLSGTLLTSTVAAAEAATVPADFSALPATAPPEQVLHIVESGAAR